MHHRTDCSRLHRSYTRRPDIILYVYLSVYEAVDVCRRLTYIAKRPYISNGRHQVARNCAVTGESFLLCSEVCVFERRWFCRLDISGIGTFGQSSICCYVKFFSFVPFFSLSLCLFCPLRFYVRTLCV